MLAASLHIVAHIVCVLNFITHWKSIFKIEMYLCAYLTTAQRNPTNKKHILRLCFCFHLQNCAWNISAMRCMRKLRTVNHTKEIFWIYIHNEWILLDCHIARTKQRGNVWTTQLIFLEWWNRDNKPTQMQIIAQSGFAY